jgi:2-polyprenyl-6-methoxyphenol hydroxylase-like FAD-dependent oxidoreductase
VTLRFEHRLAELDLDKGRLRFETPSGAVDALAGTVLASDGAYSAARRAVTFRPGFSFSQDYLEHGYKELTIPARDGEFALDPDALHIWPRGSSMMIALPNLDRSFTCTLFWPEHDFAALRTPQAVLEYFARHYPDVVDLMPSLTEDFAHNPVGALVTVRCWPWVHEGDGSTLALVGDAAHAIVPFFGQGANCAFEDCLEIDRCLDEAGGHWPAALARYETRRKANCDTIAEMALENFVEMRDKVNSRLFQAKTAAQHALERRLPHYARLVHDAAVLADTATHAPTESRHRRRGDGRRRRRRAHRSPRPGAVVTRLRVPTDQTPAESWSHEPPRPSDQQRVAHGPERMSHRSGNAGRNSVDLKYSAPADPPVPIRAPMIRSTILRWR